MDDDFSLILLAFFYTNITGFRRRGRKRSDFISCDCLLRDDGSWVFFFLSIFLVYSYISSLFACTPNFLVSLALISLRTSHSSSVSAPFAFHFFWTAFLRFPWSFSASGLDLYLYPETLFWSAYIPLISFPQVSQFSHSGRFVLGLVLGISLPVEHTLLLCFPFPVWNRRILYPLYS
jgi:hypothetical protein